MKLTCELATDEDYETIRQLFAPELERTHARSAIAIRNRHGKAVFHITAEDTTALRATLSSVTSVLGMHEKTHDASR